MDFLFGGMFALIVFLVILLLVLKDANTKLRSAAERVELNERFDQVYRCLTDNFEALQHQIKSQSKK